MHNRAALAHGRLGRCSRLLVPVLAILATTLALRPAASQQAPVVRPAPPNLLSRFDVSAGTVQQLDVARFDADVVARVRLGHSEVTIVLQPYDMRSPNFQLIEQGANGNQVVPTPPSVTYRGSLLEDPNTRVAASIIDGSLDALIHRPAAIPGTPGETWVVQPVRRVQPQTGAATHVVFRSDDTLPLPYECGLDTSDAQVVTAPAISTDTTRICEIAIEADLQFYQQNGSSITQTQNDVTTVMNQVDFIYDRDVDVTFTISALIVTTTNVYSTNDPGTLLSQFRSRWNSVNAGVQRDVAHLFTGRNLSGSVIGIAYLGVICGSNGYGLSQSRFTGNLNSRTGLTAHEIGHNFSAPHCNSSSPCYIMCSGLGGCSNNVTLFGPASINTITSYASNRPCLSVQPTVPTITSISPGSVPVFLPGAVTLTGSGFGGATSYTIGGQTFNTGFYVANDNTMSVNVPSSTQLGLTSLSVATPAGTSNAVPLSYTITSPPRMTGTVLIPPSGGTAQYDFAGTPGRYWFMVLGISNNTTPFQGFDLISNPVLLTLGQFGQPLGIESLTIPVPAGLGFIVLYAQILEADAGGAATGVSNLQVIVLQ